MRGLASLVVAVFAAVAFGQDGERVISASYARSMVSQHKGVPLPLESFTALGPGAADELCLHSGPSLSLKDVVTLEAHDVKTLARYRGRLDLRGLRKLTLDADSAKVLCDNAALKRFGLSVKQLEMLTLPAIDAATAKSLEAFTGFLNLADMTTLDAATAEMVVDLKLKGLKIEGLTAIEADVAQVLAKHKGALWLKRLTTLSDDAAKALAQHEGDLDLSGVTTLSDDAAKSLAQHKGGLHLNGLNSISDEARKALWANPEIQLRTRARR